MFQFCITTVELKYSDQIQLPYLIIMYFKRIKRINNNVTRRTVIIIDVQIMYKNKIAHKKRFNRKFDP